MITNDQFFLTGNNGKAILLMHGITSGAAQLIPMARFLNDYGYNVYGANIAGHGTYPGDLLHTTAEDFMAKAEYDYLTLKKHFSTVYVGGLSTGGLLSLYLANKFPETGAFMSVSSPLDLVKDTFISNAYSDDVVYFHREMAGKTGLFKQYHIHYEDIAIKAFKELYRLMEFINADGFMKAITVPGIVIQAKDDAVACPGSAKIIYDSISSKVKELYTPDIGEHSIILTEGRHEVFRRCAMFLTSL
jgi:carboxylesterase